jgi:hypothetical protein
VNAFNYLLAFASVVLGLAVTDLAYSLHRLLRVGHRVRWGLLVPLAGTLSFVKILVQWWSWYAGRSMGGALSFRIFALVILATMLLFLMAATALPDDLPEDGEIDLDALYMASRRRFWVLFLAHSGLMAGVGGWLAWQAGALRPVWNLWPMALVAAAGSIPLLTRSRWIHVAVMSGMLVTALFTNAGHTLPE